MNLPAIIFDNDCRDYITTQPSTADIHSRTHTPHTGTPRHYAPVLPLNPLLPAPPPPAPSLQSASQTILGLPQVTAGGFSPVDTRQTCGPPCHTADTSPWGSSSACGPLRHTPDTAAGDRPPTSGPPFPRQKHWRRRKSHHRRRHLQPETSPQQHVTPPLRSTRPSCGRPAHTGDTSLLGTAFACGPFHHTPGSAAATCTATNPTQPRKYVNRQTLVTVDTC